MRHKLLSMILFCAISMAARAQFIFQNLRWQDGLSAKEIRCLYKDHDGFLWIGTSNGLNRFDGAVIKQYKNSITQNNLYINAIQPIPGNDSMLIGTRQGIRIFDKRTGSFKIDSRFTALNNEKIEAIQTDDSLRLWIAAGSKLFVYDKGKLFPLIDIIPAAKSIASQLYSLGAFTWDNLRKGFWLGGNKTYFIDCGNKAVYSKLNNPLNYPLLNKGEILSIAIDANNDIWYASNEDKSLNFWDHRKNTVDSLYELDGKKLTGGCNRIFIDHKGWIWISTWLYAAFVKEPGKPIKKIPFSQAQPYSIGYGFFRDAIEDAEGNVWLGTINGVSKSQAQDPLQAIFQLPSFDFFLETGFAQANYIAVDKDIIMACKEEGVVAYNMTERTYKRYVVTTGDDLIRNKFVMAAKAGTTWWFAGADGVHYLEQGSNSLTRFNEVKQGTVSKSSNFIFKDIKGNIWFQVVHDAIYRYNPLTKKCDRFDGKDSSIGAFNYITSNCFLSLKNGNLLFVMNGTGFIKFDIEAEKFSTIEVKGFKDFFSNKLEEDSKGNIWAALGGRGILKISPEGKCIDSINTSNGLLYDNISSIAIDGRGAIWAGSREGLMFFNPTTKAVTKVEIDLGQTLQDYWNNITIANGKVYAVMLDHVVEIDPYRFEAVQVKKPPHLTSIKIFGKEITENENKDILELSPSEDYVTFQFASLNHREIPSLQYSYQLEGIDKDWVNAGRSLTVSYNNLSPGSYTFKVRSTDEHGKWMEKISTIKIHVEPFWWQTWWFICLCALIGILLLAIIYKNALHRRGKRNIDRTIDYFANSVYGENSVNEICWDIARNCISQLQFEDCVVYLLDEEKQVLLQKAAYGPKNPKGHEIVDPIEISFGYGIVGTVWATGKAQLIGDTTKDKRYVIDDVKRNSEISVPIFHDGKVIGVIDSEHSQKNFFTESHLKALTTIASISANKIAEANAEEVAKQNEIKLLEINKMLAESQLMALRAQMNPHFVFNCLNSIQECIVTEKYGEASKYLNKFSKLFRTVLNNSGKKLVSLDEEKEGLALYLELEQMRFEQSFTYEINMDEELETDEILMPSMLLQPYVENALWHGLMHKDGERQMMISFRRVNEDLFQCTIDDNGIGRKASFALKEQQSKAKRHESKGLQISKDRLDLLERQGYHANLNIIDKYDAVGNALGTKVEIELSTYLKNI